SFDRVLNNLFKHTAMQSAFNLNMLALVGQEPKVLSLKDVLQHHIDYRREVIRRRTEFDLGKAKDRAHILEGLKIAHANLDAIIKLSSGNYAKRMPLSTYRQQHRGGRGVIGMQTREEDDVQHLVVARNHDRLCVFTDRGRVFALKAYELPDASRTAKGTPIQNILEAMQQGERVSALVALREPSTAEFFVMATRKGFI